MTKDEIPLGLSEYLIPSVIHYFQRPLFIERGKDQYIWDANGKQYLDFSSDILTISVGRRSATVNPRIHEQIADGVRARLN